MYVYMYLYLVIPLAFWQCCQHQRFCEHKQIFVDWLVENMVQEHNLQSISFSKICKLHIQLNWTLSDFRESTQRFSFKTSNYSEEEIWFLYIYIMVTSLQLNSQRYAYGFILGKPPTATLFFFFLKWLPQIRKLCEAQNSPLSKKKAKVVNSKKIIINYRTSNRSNTTQNKNSIPYNFLMKQKVIISLLL